MDDTNTGTNTKVSNLSLVLKVDTLLWLPPYS